MNKLRPVFERLVRYFTEYYRQEKAVTLFIKAMFLVGLFRLTRLWMAAEVFFYDYSASFPRSFIGKVALWPAMMAQDDPRWFFAIGGAILIAGVFMRPNYGINILFLWFALNFFKVRYPATNGADFVLLTLSALMIPLGFWPRSGSKLLTIPRIALYNASRVLIQIQVLTIYLISGWDKITNVVWRSGEAFEYIAHLDVMFNPIFTPVFEHKSVQLVLAWATIAFELLFIPLVYIERTRIPILMTGFIFHLFIWLMLGLPDFAWMMIAAYPIFLRDTDFRIFQQRKSTN